MSSRPPTAPPLAATLVLALLAALWGGAPAQAAHTAQRIAGADRIETSVALSRTAHPDGADVVLLARADDPADALAGGPLAAAEGGPVLLTPHDAVIGSVRDEIRRLGARQAVLLGGTAALSEAVAGTLAAEGLAVVRVAGAERAATAAAIADRLVALHGAPATVHLVHTWEDALAVSWWAARRGEPLLVAAPDGLPAATAEALERWAPGRAVLVGTLADAAGLHDRLRARGIAVDPLGAADVYATSAAAATAAVADGADATQRFVATGRAFPDALVAGPVVAASGGVLLLVDGIDPGGSPPTRTWVVDAPHGTDRLLGGPAALTPEVAAALHGYTATIAPLSAEQRATMTGTSWHEGCPVHLDDLHAVTVDHRGFDGLVRRGVLVVHREVAADVADVLAALFAAAFPIERIEPVDVHGGDDDAAMAANATSAFNCRPVAGTSRWSRHAHGDAIDLNPVQNPWVRGQEVAPPAGAAYLDRTDVRPGMVVRPGPVVDAFAAIGWGWGGDWSSTRDYQHFSATGT